MSNTKFNLSKTDEKKGFNISKNDGAASKFNLTKEKTTAHATTSDSTSSASNGGKKSKLWLWILLVLILIGTVFLLIKNTKQYKNSEIVSQKIEQATISTNDVEAKLQDSTVTVDELQSKVAEAQQAIDEANKNAKSNEEKQSVSDAQAKVDKVKAEVENIKNAKESVKEQTTDANNDTAKVDVVNADEQVKANDNSANNQPQKTTASQSKMASTVGVQSNTEKSKATISESGTQVQGTLEEKAKQVIRGDFGNGIERKNALGEDYRQIQDKVNELYKNGTIY